MAKKAGSSGARPGVLPELFWVTARVVYERLFITFRKLSRGTLKRFNEQDFVLDVAHQLSRRLKPKVLKAFPDQDWAERRYSDGKVVYVHEAALGLVTGPLARPLTLTANAVGGITNAHKVFITVLVAFRILPNAILVREKPSSKGENNA